MQPGFWDLGQGSTFFVREMLDGIGTKPGGDYQHKSRQVFHAAPWGASNPKTYCNDNFKSTCKKYIIYVMKTSRIMSP
jgi:hypothetical protein